MIAFASNSLLCRLALKQTTIDAATFTLDRILSGAIALWVVVALRRKLRAERTALPAVESSSASSPITRHSLLLHGNWPSALALYIYAAEFSFAYISLSA